MDSGEYVVLYEDEVSFYLASTITRKWAKKGVQPIVKSGEYKKRVGYFGFVEPASGKLVTVEFKSSEHRTFIKAIETAVEVYGKDKKILIILDNVSSHHKAQKVIECNNLLQNVTFLYLPTYSPDLNPIERVWRITRKEQTHNRFFSCLSEIRETLNSYFRRFLVDNSKLKTLCTTDN